MATKRLGRGLEALIHGDGKSSSNKPGVIEIPIKENKLEKFEFGILSTKYNTNPKKSL